ncbi:MAG: O-antigen ligase family protein [Flavobacteriaceae bacterium]|nr:O-antigen ligase family protein [Flavobacteriaceae bacterium]
MGRFNSNLARSIINFLNYLPVLDKTDYIDGRLAAVSFEVPALGNYFIFMYGWMFSYAFTEKTWYKKFLPSIFLILFTVLSGARAALIIVLFQALLGSIFFLKVKKIRINYKLKYGALIALFLIILSNWNKLETIFSQKLNLFDVEHSISNKTRYGMQYASLMVFKDEPITGVGFGQNGFHKQRYYPDWALKNNYEFTDWYLDENVYSFAPDFNLYTRLLAETGLIGVFLFVCFLCIVLKNTLSMLCSTSNEVVIFGVILFLSFVGFIINWLQIDHFRQFGFWVCISLLIWLKNENSLGKA